jgi:hypothetical protein
VRLRLHLANENSPATPATPRSSRRRRNRGTVRLD